MTGRPKRRYGLACGCVCLMLAAVGCAHTKIAETAASTAISQLEIYDREVGAKIRAENDYYENVMSAAETRINELWTNEQPFRFEQECQAFAKSNVGLSAAAADTKLADLFNTVMNAWARRDADYADLIADTNKVLSENRRKLEMEQAKISQLRNKLMTLSEAASDKEMLKLAIGFVRETKESLDGLSKAGKTDTGASGSATK